MLCSRIGLKNQVSRIKRHHSDNELVPLEYNTLKSVTASSKQTSFGYMTYCQVVETQCEVT